MTDDDIMLMALEALTNAIAVRNGEGGTKLVSPLEENAIAAIQTVLAHPPQPVQEQQQARVDVIAVNLMREGINKHRARELADHFVNFTLTPPLPVQEPVAWDKPSASFNEWWDGDRRRDNANPFTTDSFAYWGFEGWQAALAQRPWQGLGAEDLAQIESDDFWQVGNHMAIAMAVEAALRSKNT